MTSRAAGRDAILLELEGQDETRAWYAEVLRRRESGGLAAEEVVPGARTVLLSGVAEPDALRRELAAWRPPPPVPPVHGGLVELPVTYDGADLADVAGQWGCSEEAAVRTHTETVFVVAFCGFSPGFAYLSGLPEHLHVPRLATPRDRVPAGSVALAGPWCAVYPSPSPGGWLLLGRTDAVLFDPDRDPPAVLPPRARVRFRAVRD